MAIIRLTGQQPRSIVVSGDGTRETISIGTLDQPIQQERINSRVVLNLINAHLDARMERLLGLFIEDDEELSLASAMLRSDAQRDDWLVYADWLEEHGRQRQADRLRAAAGTTPANVTTPPNA